MTTTETDHKAFMRREAAELFNQGNYELVDEFVAEDYVGHNPASPEASRGPVGYKQNVELFHGRFPT